MRNAIRSSLSSIDSKSDNRKTIFVYGRQGKMGDVNIHPDDLSAYGEMLCPSEVKSIIGHYSYNSLASYLGHYNTYGKAFTLVRHPLDRVISNINYIRASPSHGAHPYYSKFSGSDIFDHLVSSGLSSLGTYMLDMLSLEHEIDNSLLSINQRVEKVSSRVVIYKVENSREALLNHIAPLSRQDYNPINATKDRINIFLPDRDNQKVAKNSFLSLDQFSDSQIGKLLDIYAPDLELYNYAR